jgi:hypothetical protein
MANTNPIFALTPDVPIVTVTAATTDRTGATTTNLVNLLTATSSGTKITQIGAKVAGNNAATLVLIFITDTAGANPKLFDEIALPAVTAGQRLLRLAAKSGPNYKSWSYCYKWRKY